MTTSEEAVPGSVFTPGRVACGAAVVACMLLTRRVRALERQVKDVARQLARDRRLSDRREGQGTTAGVVAVGVARGAAVVATAAADVADLCAARRGVQELIRRGEAAARAFAACD